MELYQLRTFVAVAHHGHLTKASEALHLSQPAVTAQIKALEEELAVPLFSRTPNGVVLTPAGQELVKDAERVLGMARDMRGKALQLKMEVLGKLTIGTILDPVLMRIGGLFKGVKERFPLLELQTCHQASGHVLNNVRKKELDCGFYLGNNPYSNVFALRLSELDFSVIAPPNWEAELDGLDLDSSDKVPWVAGGPFTGYEKIQQEFFRQHNLSPHKNIEVDHESSIIATVTAGAGISLLRHEVAVKAEADGLLKIWHPHAITAHLSFVTHVDHRDELIMRSMLEIVKNEWGIHP
ncbi:LysR family transcriptional regulator [Leeia sp. TBRC 13508]|uniref:LysR family transcriptional regulator n=1 Tax=Leeia speluncae TaxID=2884804 RepID=A0ABS8D2T1_9NEIS|nr:LysR family transcriptional regulator [Leeia speluncae]MCB6181953.1 LysR family transcriptional regulator [Leeia speluncae]